MSEKCCCSKSGKIKLLYSCSGAADVGKLADKTTRYLAKCGWGKMTCLAALGAELSGFIASAEGVDENVVIDGCNVKCAAKIFDKLGISYTSVVLTDNSVKKGKTKVDNELVEKMSKKIMCG